MGRNAIANSFQDLASIAVIGAGNTFATPVAGSGVLTGVDLVDCDGNMTTAILTTTAVAGAGTVVMKMQESNDNSTWVDIPGAVFTVVSAAQAQQIISFQNQKRYVAGFATLTGTSVTLQLTILGQRKVAPANKGGWTNETGAT